MRLWWTETFQIIKILSGHTGTVNSVSFSPNGRILASGNSDKTIKFWNVETGDQIQFSEVNPAGFVK